MKYLRRFHRVRRIGTPLYPDESTERFRALPLQDVKVSAAVQAKIVAALPATAPSFSCQDGKNLAVIIPFRKREAHLETLLPKLTKYLSDAGISFQIHVVEQADLKPFNCGKLLNIGAEISKNWADYYSLHDVDFIPIDVCYQLPSFPIRAITLIDQVEGRREIPTCCFGGNVILSKEHMFQVNGFSNNYWHWGKEDDDFLLRCLLEGLVPFEDTEGHCQEMEDPTSRQSDEHGNVVQSDAEKSRLRSFYKSNRKRRNQLAKGVLDHQTDGLNSLQYELVSQTQLDDYILTRVKL